MKTILEIMLLADNGKILINLYEDKVRYIMSKINAIEKELSNINDSVFHKLIDRYLSKKYGYLIHSIGTKSGEDKPTAGTPDTLITLSNGNYIFVEYTTQKSGVKAKFLGDLEKCFDASKTGIAISNIQEIILACNAKLGPKEINTLSKKCQEKNISCTVLTLSAIANEILNHHPDLAQEFLHVEADTGQILEIDDFLKHYSNTRYAIPLEGELYFRENEQKATLASIEKNSITTLAGIPGVGKTKLALECCRAYASNEKRKLYCILQRGSVDIMDDIRTYFSSEEKFLVLIDDANRISYGLEYFLEFFSEKIKNGDIKLVLTVRGYAMGKIKKLLEAYEWLAEDIVTLEPFEHKHMRYFLEKYGLRDWRHIDKIVAVSKGNPRFMIMMLRLLEQDKGLVGLENISTIYQRFFASVDEDIEIEEDEILLKAAAIIAFYGAVDKNNLEQIQEVQSIFGVDVESFWRTAQKLHSLELADMYEDEIVKVSDQILATYLFYETVFNKKLLHVKAFLEPFLEKNQERIRDTFYPILEDFSSEAVEGALIGAINEIYSESIGVNERRTESLLELFCFLKPLETLQYLKEKINNLEEESRFSESLYLYFFGKLLKITDSCSMTQALMLEYCIKRPSKNSEIIEILTEYHDKDSVIQAQERCALFLDKLVEKMKIYPELDALFFSLTQAWLEHFLGEEHEGFRKKIWENIFKQLANKEQEVLGLLGSYCSPWRGTVRFDIKILPPFFYAKLNPGNSRHCYLVNAFIECCNYERLSVKTTELSTYFFHEAIRVYQLFSRGHREVMKSHSGMGYEEIEALIAGDIKEYIGGFELEDFKQLILLMGEALQWGSICLEIERNFCTFFSLLDDFSDTILDLVVRFYLSYADSFGLYCFNAVRVYYKRFGKDATWSLIEEQSSKTAEQLRMTYFSFLESWEIGGNEKEKLLTFFQTANLSCLSIHKSRIKNFIQKEMIILVEIFRIIKARESKNEDCLSSCNSIFRLDLLSEDEIKCFIGEDLNLAKWAYDLGSKRCDHFDHNGKILNLLLNHAPDFLGEHLLFSLEERKTQYRDFNFLWARKDVFPIVTSVFSLLYSAEKKREVLPCFAESALELFFKGGDDRLNDTLTPKEKQIEFLEKYVKEHTMDEIDFLFRMVVCKMDGKIKKRLLKVFICVNKNIEDFKRLKLEPSNHGWSGSSVVYFTKRLEDLELLGEIFKDDIDLLDHFQILKKQCASIKSRVEWSKKREFMDNC